MRDPAPIVPTHNNTIREKRCLSTGAGRFFFDCDRFRLARRSFRTIPGPSGAVSVGATGTRNSFVPSLVAAGRPPNRASPGSIAAVERFAAPGRTWAYAGE